MKRVLSVLLILAMLLALAACGKDDGMVKVGIISGEAGESAYRAARDANLQSVFTLENGYQAAYACVDSHGDQVAAAQAFIKEKVDYLVICAAEAAGWETVLQSAQKARIPVIFFDCAVDADESLYAGRVVSDPAKQGQQAVQWLEQQDLDKYRIVHLREGLGRGAALEEKAAADDQWKLVAQETADGAGAQALVLSLIEAGESFNVVYAESGELARGAVAALDAKGVTHGLGGDVVILSFGSEKAVLEEMLKGYWNYDGQVSPFYGSYIHDMIQSLEAGNAPGQKVVTVEEKGFDANTITVGDMEKYGI